MRRKLVVVSNREPYSFKPEGERIDPVKSMGGLVSALDPVVAETRGRWICWEGASPSAAETFRQAMQAIEDKQLELPYALHGVPVSEEEIRHYYFGYANQVLWPLFHYFTDRCHFYREHWEHYRTVNRKFARMIIDNTEPEDLIWIQDYHLMLAPGLVRQAQPDRNLGFFCHIPFPHADVFRILPQRKDILRGSLRGQFPVLRGGPAGRGGLRGLRGSNHPLPGQNHPGGRLSHRH
jgi:trehalose 6-phosphate synthase/phosphatase